MSGYNPDLYLDDTARREELARAEEILNKYRSRSTGVTTSTTTNVPIEKSTVGQRFHEDVVRSEVEGRRYSPMEKTSEYRSEYVRKIPEEEVTRSRKVIDENEGRRAERESYPSTSQYSQYNPNVQNVSQSKEYVSQSKESIDETKRSKSATSPKKGGFMAKIKSLFRKGDKTSTGHTETTTTASTGPQTIDDTADVIYALVKVQRWDERTGLERGFRDEGFYTTLKMNRSSLYERGLTKDHSIISWLRREKIYLDDIIDSPTRTHIKQLLGLSPRDNIRLELVEDPTALLNTTEMRPINYGTASWGPETSFRERIYPDDKLYYPYSTWETTGPVQFSGKPRNILGIGDFKGEGMIQGTNIVSRIMRGATEGLEHVVSGRRDFEERDHTILGRRDLNYPIRPQQYYNRNDEVFRGDDFLARDRIPREKEYADKEVGVHREDFHREEEYGQKKSGFGQLMRETKEGIRATLHGNREPEYEEGTKPSAGQQIKEAFKGAMLSAKAHKGESGFEHDVHDTNVEKIEEKRVEEKRVIETDVNRGVDRELYEEKKPGLMKRTAEGIKATMHGTNEPEYVEGTKPSAGQQIKEAFQGAVFAAKDKQPTETYESKVVDKEVVRDKAFAQEERNIASEPFTSGAVVTDKPTFEEKTSKFADYKNYESDNVGSFDEGIRANVLPYRQEITHSKPTVGERVKSIIQEKKVEMKGGDIYNEPTVTEYDPVVRKNDLADKGFHSGHQEWTRGDRDISSKDYYNREAGVDQEKVHISSSQRPSERFYDKGHPNPYYSDEPLRYK